MTRANATSSRRAADGLAGEGADDDARQGRGGEGAGVSPADAAGAGVAEAAGDRAGGDDHQRRGGRARDVLVEDVDEDRDGEHRSAAAEHADGDADGQPERDGEQHLAQAVGSRLLDRPALALPQRHAAVDDVDDVAGAVALHEAGADGGALPGGADDRDGLVGSRPSGTASMSW